MAKSIVTEQEYARLIEQLEFFDTTRNQILSFSFTAVLAMIGAALAISSENINTWVYLTPYLLVIPFAARISYYRLASAHIGSFLKKFAPERMLFAKGAETVKEGQCRWYGIIAWLINHEMLMLAATVTTIFYMKYFDFPNQSISLCNSYLDTIALLLPLVLLLVVYFISDATYNYKTLMNTFMNGWDSYIPQIQK